MAADRLDTLCGQTALTGIDFIEVRHPHVQKVLRVFFVVDPTTTTPMPMALPTPQQVTIESVNAGHPAVTVTETAWQLVGSRTVLRVKVAEPGDFSLYRLTILSSRVDRFFNGVVFSFKQGCPSVFDCRHERECPPDDLVDVPVDYLARDFESLRNALLDFSARRYPHWHERIPADPAVMIMELAAALGDELAFVQDAIARESTLETLAERRSLRWQTRLVDFPLNDGASATTLLDVSAAPGVHVQVVPGTLVQALPEGEAPIPFEIGRGLADQSSTLTQADLDELQRLLWISDTWNHIKVHVPDPGKPCVEAGATEIYLVGRFPRPADLPGLADPKRFWIGRRVLLRVDPINPELPRRRHVVRLAAYESFVDPLAPGAPTITRIAWDPSDAVPFDTCLTDAYVDANLLPATAGRTCTEWFAIHCTPDTMAPADCEKTAMAVERQGPVGPGMSERPPTFLYSLRETEGSGLGWLNGVPEVELQEVDATLTPIGAYWAWRRGAVECGTDELDFMLDDGTWRTVISFDRPAGRFQYVDRASGAGMTVRFGDDEFGRLPAEGTLFQVRYRTDAGRRANLPADSVTSLAGLSGVAIAVTNPLPVIDGRDAVDIATVRQMAPEAYKVRPERAVRDEDYREIVERMAWVQRAGATARWTGSWLTEFVTADPEGTIGLDDDHRGRLERRLDVVRQAGRPVTVRDPVYLPVDLRILICVQPSSHEGQVLERVTRALAGPRRPLHDAPFFDPDHFTFGTPLNRAALEAAIQSVPGVLAVEEIRIRVRGRFDWRVLTEFVYQPGDERVLRLDNDPSHPESGALLVTARNLVA